MPLFYNKQLSSLLIQQGAKLIVLDFLILSTLGHLLFLTSLSPALEIEISLSKLPLINYSCFSFLISLSSSDSTSSVPKKEAPHPNALLNVPYPIATGTHFVSDSMKSFEERLFSLNNNNKLRRVLGEIQRSR